MPLDMLFYFTRDMLVITMESSHILNPTAHPIPLYNGQDGRYQYPVKHIKSHRLSYPIVPWTRWMVPASIPILSYCTMDTMDGTREYSQYPLKHIKSHRPSYPIVPWTRWTVPRNPSIQSNI